MEWLSLKEWQHLIIELVCSAPASVPRSSRGRSWREAPGLWWSCAGAECWPAELFLFWREYQRCWTIQEQRWWSLVPAGSWQCRAWSAVSPGELTEVMSYSAPPSSPSLSTASIYPLWTVLLDACLRMYRQPMVLDVLQKLQINFDNKVKQI